MLYDKSCDIRNPLFLEFILRRLAYGYVYWLHIAPACRTFSNACRPAVRSKEHIYGLPNLTQKKRSRVDDGSLIALLCLLCCCMQSVGGGWYSIENPLTSLIWRLPSYAQWSAANSYKVVFDYCMFGMPWRKSTIFGTNASFLVPHSRRCSRDHKHVELSGNIVYQGKKGKATALAAAYPSQLCAHLSNLARINYPSRCHDHSWAPKELAKELQAASERCDKLSDSVRSANSYRPEL